MASTTSLKWEHACNRNQRGQAHKLAVLFALPAATGMRIGEAAGLHVDDLDLDSCVLRVRRGVWNGREQTPKTTNAVREIDIDFGLAEMLRQHVGEKRAGRVFEARNGSPISGPNVVKRVLHPLLKRLELPEGWASRLPAFASHDAAEKRHA
jgi:integrase